MVTKKRAPVAVVTEGAAQAALRRGPARELSPDEEKVMRMRLGASPPRAAPLERVFEERTDLEIEVLAAEIEAFMRLHAREEERRERLRAEPRPSLSPSFSRTKQKIIRALRRK